MKRELKKFESTMWLCIKLLLYILLMGTFMFIMSRENKALGVLSRTMGITFSTYCIVGLLFLSIYGKYDVGRRKSKPIIYSLSLAVLFTDIVTYIQLMIMNTITPSIYAFRLDSIGSLILSFIVQVIIIIIFAYAGNGLFFTIHKPESCCIVTSSQESLDNIVRGILKYKKQYKIDYIMDYRDRHLLETVKKADTVFIHDVPLEVRSKIVRFCYKYKINIYFNPEIEDIVEMSAKYYLLDDVSVLNANVKAWTMEQRVMKKLLDMSLAIVLGIVTSPIWIVSAIAIKAYDGGHIFFKQKRATLNGRVFEVYKFRTMKENVENHSVTDDDDRITKPGRILRKIRMDELPQLINILKGEMSLVGPRPERPELAEIITEHIPEFTYRLKVKAGLTGYAQIYGKYNTTAYDKLKLDLTYIRNYSLILDFKLMLMTPKIMLMKESTGGVSEEFLDPAREPVKKKKQ